MSPIESDFNKAEKMTLKNIHMYMSFSDTKLWRIVGKP